MDSPCDEIKLTQRQSEESGLCGESEKIGFSSTGNIHRELSFHGNGDLFSVTQRPNYSPVKRDASSDLSMNGVVARTRQISSITENTLGST